MILFWIIGVIVLVVLGTIFNGYALSILWAWFIAPTFHLPELSVTQAIGIAIVVNYLTHRGIDAEKEKK